MDGPNEASAQTVVVVDDEPTNVELLKAILRQVPDVVVLATTDSTEALDLIQSNAADLVLLDLMMPRINGYEIIEQTRARQAPGEFLPILVLTADASREAIHQSLAVGATDFLAKPFDPTETLLRINNLLRTKALHRTLSESNVRLEVRVSERTADLGRAKLEILERLARVTEYRDDITGEHTKRVGDNAAMLWRELGLPDSEVSTIGQAAPLHDVGKVGIPDSILLKPGRLTPEEFEVVKRHTTIGASILAGSDWSVLQMAERIARWHHERWDGTGYPDGLAGDAIPVESRIVLVCDVFDALVSDRPYKKAWSTGDAVEEIRRSAGTIADPDVVDAFCRLAAESQIEA